MKNTLIVLLGPTGVGKTSFALELAEKYGSVIISADSRQFYREMSIGTAVPSAGDLIRARHYFIRFISVRDYYSSNLFERDVLELLPGLFKAGNIAIMAGGSALYIDAVCHGTDDIPDVDPAAREKYTRLYKENGIEGLRMALKLLDPAHYSRVDLRNHMRIIRALEICDTTGRPYSSFLKKEKKERDFRILKIGLNMDRSKLYSRINARVDQMLKDGLEEEARCLYPVKHLNALNTVGYREMFDWFDGIISREEAIRLIKRNTRRFARRQLTWWARDKSIRWFDPADRIDIIRFLDESITQAP